MDANKNKFAYIPERICGLGELAYNLWWSWHHDAKMLFKRLSRPAMYNILEKQVIPLYYKLDDDGIPHDWVKVMKEAIKGTAPIFNARRMVKEYVKKLYQNLLKSTPEVHI